MVANTYCGGSKVEGKLRRDEPFREGAVGAEPKHAERGHLAGRFVCLGARCCQSQQPGLRAVPNRAAFAIHLVEGS